MAVAVQRKGSARSTQSFVGVMARVWKRPTTTLLELGWRWAAGTPLLLLALFWSRAHAAQLGEMLTQLEAMTFFRPAEMASTLGTVSQQIFALAAPQLRWFVPVALLWWTGVGAIGQTLLARRLSPDARPTLAVQWGFRLVRSLGVLLCWALWAGIVLSTAHATLTARTNAGAEPNVLLFLATLIVLSLALFTGWAAVGWPFALAQAVNARTGYSFGASLHLALAERRARAEVLEISMVMCIVKLALLVLALTFSACPLPFQAVASAEFLRNWWIAVGVLYFFMSDYFHTVRFAAFLHAAEPAADA